MDDETLRVTRRATLAGAAAIGAAAALPRSVTAAEPSISAVVDAGRERPQLSRWLYGGFLEHIGGVINDSLWSELLADRKFYHPVNSEPAPQGPRGPGGTPGAPGRKWIPIGPDAAVTMDAEAAYVGAHSPVVQLDGSEARGVAQSGLALVAGKDYVGRIVIAADRGVDVTATLIWGPGAGDRQSVRVRTSRDWTTRPLEFTAQGESGDGRLEIVGEGSGSFRVGAVSLMPADNVDGFRADTIALMREMDCGMIRIPGGNFVSAYDWKNTIGDPDRRPPILDPVWNALQPNDVGVDELLRMCELIGAEPAWCVNSGFGEPRSGAELVEYANGSADTEWGAKRAANGRAEPWAVKYWNIGNEMYGNWQFGQMAREQYGIKHNLFADAMRRVDPTIYIIAPGGFADEMTTGQGLVVPGQYKVEIGSERDWAYGMFKNCRGRFDGLSTHTYPAENRRYNYTTGELIEVEQTLNEWARAPANRIRTMYDCWVDYKALFPELEEGRVKVFFDEWAYHFQDDLKGALAVALAFHEFFRHTDFIEMAGYTMATAWLSFDRTRSTVSTKGGMFQLYNRRFGAIPVAISGDSPVPPPQYPIGGDQPRVNSGSDTWPLDVSAALTADRRALVVAVVNATEEARTLDLALEGFVAGGTGRCWKLTGPSVDATNRVGQEPQVTVAESTFDAAARTLDIAPISVELYEYPSA